MNCTEAPLPSCDLYDLVLDFNWDAVVRHSKEHPQDAEWQDYDGDDGGGTPLYLACQFSAPLFAIEALLDANPEALQTSSRKGNTPLHVACYADANQETISVLLRHDPTSVYCGNKQGKTPLNALIDGIDARSALCLPEPSISVKQQQTIELILNAVARAEGLIDRSSAESLLLHAAVSFGNGCPLPVFEFILHRHVHQVHIRDTHRRLPLHIAAGPPRPARFGSKCLLSRDQRTPAIIDSLLRDSQDGARVRDGQGRLPLHIAIANGHHWHQGVESLFVAEPEAVTQIDPITSLPPFLLAAATHVQGKNTHSLNTVYCLLRSEPHMLAI